MQKCHLHSLSTVGGAITAQHRNSSSEDTGYTFLNCKITGVGTALLGRPWGPYSRVVFALTYMSSVVVPQGWDDWGDPSKQRYMIIPIHSWAYVTLNNSSSFFQKFNHYEMVNLIMSVYIGHQFEHYECEIVIAFILINPSHLNSNSPLISVSKVQ